MAKRFKIVDAAEPPLEPLQGELAGARRPVAHDARGFERVAELFRLDAEPVELLLAGRSQRFPEALSPDPEQSLQGARLGLRRPQGVHRVEPRR